MKIVFLSDDFPPKSFGGAGIVAFSQARELVKRGHDVSVITASATRRKVEKTAMDGISIYTISSSISPRLRPYVSLYNPTALKQIRAIIKQINPDIVHAHNIHQTLSYASLSIARKYAKKVFITFHDAMPVHYGKLYPKIETSNGEKKFNYKISLIHQIKYFKFRWNPLRNIIIRMYVKKADARIAVSHALAQALRENGLIVDHVLHNGVDPIEFSVIKQEVSIFRDTYGLNGKKVLFFGGRISRAKGGNVALELLIRISKSIPNVCLLIAGAEDEYVKELKRKAAKENLGNNIVTTGWLDRKDISAAYCASDIVLTLSLYLDPFPTINLEAMASRKPVLGTCLGGTPEAVKDGVTGYIVNPYDREEVEGKALKLLAGTEQAQTFGKAGYERVVERFNLSFQTNSLEKIYAITK